VSASGRDRLLGWLRLTHPFPSVLDGFVSGGVAVAAGAPFDLAVRVGGAMTLAQLGIGALNDVVDADRDAGRKPGKPIPAGLISPGAAGIAAGVLLAAGLVVAAVVRIELAALAAVVIAIGLAYDLRLKGTAWSWLPFAVGIPILPVFGWVGASGGLHPVFAILLPTAVAAGAALAIGNSAVDVERDTAAGGTSVAAVLGPRRATLLTAGLLALVAALATVSALAGGAGPPEIGALAAIAAMPVAATILAADRTPVAREWAWRIDALGLGALAVLWLRVVLS